MRRREYIRRWPRVERVRTPAPPGTIGRLVEDIYLPIIVESVYTEGPLMRMLAKTPAERKEAVKAMQRRQEEARAARMRRHQRFEALR